MASKSLYFGYGSNLWKQQMSARCPENKYLGIARLVDWRWIINERGYANVIPSEGDEVWALLYELSQSDEKNLDRYEGVPVDYVKQNLQVEYYGHGEENKKIVEALVYVDVERVTGGWPPQTEYIHRMNCGIADALAQGISQTYISKYLRQSIPETKEE
ncbi:Butirosin biosynthesis, BtrG-like protein [Roridomyces roridus]|uniref:gamma-glutamylcyclotransferase n=1 Tax=Roridomyces roridus TaxID=1738132 RepID=A0AAD7BXB4_9AGAR|nr:Butirosin biosynthesis, BtrG-like protein [Roridomyces roridus]